MILLYVEILKRFTPTEYVNSIYDIDILSLKNKGIKVLVADIDNTLAKTKERIPAEAVVRWIEKAKSYGMHVVLSSNNSQKRVSEYNKSLKLFAVHRAYKPFKYGFSKIAKKFNVQKHEICMIGDQIFTDIWGANKAGVMSVLVMPLSTDEGIGIRLKRYVEHLILKKSKINTYCLVGNPVAHSKSPMLHGIIYKHCGIKAHYMLCFADNERLGGIVSQFKAFGVKGFNITVPFKHDIMQYLDYVSDDATRIGTVNVVKISGGKCYGYNTDGEGFIMQLKSDKTKIENSKIKIIGAGGATPAIVYALTKEGVGSIAIYNRTFEKAEEIAKRFQSCEAKRLEEFEASDCDILINTTSAGLFPNTENSPVDNLDGISPQTVLYDIIYNPSETKLMRMARKKGCKAHNGVKLLIYQGLLADEIWFERKFTDESLVQKIINEMGVE